VNIRNQQGEDSNLGDGYRFLEQVRSAQYFNTLCEYPARLLRKFLLVLMKEPVQHSMIGKYYFIPNSIQESLIKLIGYLARQLHSYGPDTIPNVCIVQIPIYTVCQ